MNWVKRLFRRDPRFGTTGRNESEVKNAPDLATWPHPNAAQHVTAGNALLAEGNLDAAATSYLDATLSDQTHVPALINLGFVLLAQSRPMAASEPLRRALALAPDSPDVHYLLGDVALRQRDIAGAVGHFRKTIQLQPGLAVSYRDLGRALHEGGLDDQAVAVLRAGIAIEPTFADLHYYLGNVQAALGDPSAALVSYKRALELQPDYAAVRSNLSPVLLDLCDFEGAAAAARSALSLNPRMHHAHSNLLLAMSSDPRCAPQDYLAEARRFGVALTDFALGIAETNIRPHHNRVIDGPTPLKIGFVSADLRRHPVGYFLQSVLAHWDATDMIAVAYSNSNVVDRLTARLQSNFSAWHNIADVRDMDARRLIEANGIDILIDLSGHTSGNRLPLFALRPAPVQVTWLGYWASTGLPAIDFVLSDLISLPPAQRHHFTESVCYVPDTRLCFSMPDEGEAPSVTPPPAMTRGYVTFGSFQRLTKLNDRVLALWSRVLCAVPGARLRIQAAQLGNSSDRERLLNRLTAAGIVAAHVDLVSAVPHADYLAAYSHVDIVLDTFPHSGATTTCEALWMGVPTITLMGDTMLSRQGASLLQCAGLEGWVAASEEEFIARAVQHSGDLKSLALLRSGLRRQVVASALFDSIQFAAHFQQALRRMWHTMQQTETEAMAGFAALSTKDGQ